MQCSVPLKLKGRIVRVIICCYPDCTSESLAVQDTSEKWSLYTQQYEVLPQVWSSVGLGDIKSPEVTGVNKEEND